MSGGKPMYYLLRERCGLSISEASDFHNTSLNTVKKWSSGDRNPPEGIIAELRGLYRQIEAMAALIEAGKPATARNLPPGAQDAAIGLAAIKQA